VRETGNPAKDPGPGQRVDSRIYSEAEAPVGIHAAPSFNLMLPRLPGLPWLPEWMAGVSGAGVLGCLVVGQMRFAAGLGLGSGIAFLGYWWLQRGIGAAFDSGRARAPVSVFVKLALRYPLAIGAVLLFDRTGWLPARAVMAGLFAPLAGVLIACLVLAARAWCGPGERQGKAFSTRITEAH
jgi:hypothetical protein